MNTKKIVIGGIIFVGVIAGVIFTTTGGAPFSKPTASTQGSALVSLPPAPSTTEEPASYTLNDVAQHTTPFDCWMAIEGKVYNVTNYIGKHPGGKAILRGCGKDATTLFNTRPDGPGTPHPPEAKQILQEFFVGNLKE